MTDEEDLPEDYEYSAAYDYWPECEWVDCIFCDGEGEIYDYLPMLMTGSFIECPACDGEGGWYV